MNLPVLLILCLFLSSSVICFSQEENAIIKEQSTRYVNLKIKSLDKYDTRLEHQQDHLLKKLQKKENRYRNKLKKTDSAGYVRLQENPMSYDSIRKISKNDTGELAQGVSLRKNKSIDSVRDVQSFLQTK